MNTQLPSKYPWKSSCEPLGFHKCQVEYHCTISTDIAVKQTCLRLLWEWNLVQLSPWSGTFRFGSSGCTFHGTGFYIPFWKVSKLLCSDLQFRV